MAARTQEQEKAVGVQPQEVRTIPLSNGQLKIFKLYRKSKKTPQNPEGKELMQMTYAESEEQALALASRLYEEKFGKMFWVEETK